MRMVYFKFFKSKLILINDTIIVIIVIMKMKIVTLAMNISV